MTAAADEGSAGAGVRRGPEPAFLVWSAILVLVLLAIVLKAELPWVFAFPRDWLLPVADRINVVVDALLPVLKPGFRAISAALDWPMRAVRDGLVWLPWPAVFLATGALAWRASGPKLAVYAVLALTYMLLSGYWTQSMSTLSLVVLAVPISVAAGFGLGALGYRFPLLKRPLMALLDLMQTMPAFAYLIPLLLLFGFGPVVGLIASAIFATPPMVRNTLLGLERVPAQIREAGLMSGCTPRQQFWMVEVPTAKPQLLIGFNQTTMAALAMVIIAAIIGGFEDIGWEVLSSMRKAEFGQSMLSGLVIALLAIMIDRTTMGFARKESVGTGFAFENGKADPESESRNWLPYVLLAAVALAVALRLAWPDASLLPQSGLKAHMNMVNRWLTALVRDFGWAFEGLKHAVLYSLILPLRLGIAGVATPAVWGVTPTPALIGAYAAGFILLAGLAASRFGWRAAVAVLLGGVLLYTGFLGFPWPLTLLIVGLVAWQVSGLGLMLFAVAGLGLVLVSGLWVPMMQSLYLTLLTVVVCLIVGGGLGVLAAGSDRFSAVIRPVCDALQTMPQFVFLIPALMLFKVGEFTALIAMFLYAVVPPIRYFEHGIRHVRADVIEAVTQMGATRRQTLFEARFPLAWPVMMLGVNQTIMATLSMLAIAALVGTRELGQEVYIALGKADAGMGLTAGLAIAFLAMLSDRLIQAWVKDHPADP